MKIQLFSDLHVEFGHDYVPQWDGESEILLLAGDIHLAKKAENYSAFLMKLSSQGWDRIFLIAGNHEAYNYDYDKMLKEMPTIAATAGVEFLENDVVELTSDINLIAGTMWTDLSDPQVALMAKYEMNDYRIIRKLTRKLTPEDTTQMFFKFRDLLDNSLDPFKKNIVMTHTAPHEMSGAKEYKGDALNAAYYTDMSEHMPLVHTWIHGHMHNTSKYKVGDCQVLANPYGYHGGGYDMVNPDFDHGGMSFKV